MMSIKYIVVMNLNMHKNLLQTDSWNIYHGIRGVGIFLFLLWKLINTGKASLISKSKLNRKQETFHCTIVNR